jgi:hypothetical protein
MEHEQNRDIARIYIPNTDKVVLSACQYGQSKQELRI